MATNNALKSLSNSELAHNTMYSERQVELIKTQIMPKASDDELMLFIQVSSHRKLDPFMKQIYAVQYAGKWSYQVSIDGLRLIAQRSGRYRGQTEPQWCGPDGKWVDVWLKEEPPAAARVGVWIEGNPQPLMAVALYNAFVARTSNGQPNTFWARMPEHMLAKCAEAQALRKAFPEEAGGLYTSDEMGQAASDRPYVDADGVIEGNVRVIDEPKRPGRAPQSSLDKAKLDLWMFASKTLGWDKATLEAVGRALTGESLEGADAERLRFIHDDLLQKDPEEIENLVQQAKAA